MTRTYRTTDAAATLAALSGQFYGQGRGPLGTGITGGPGMWEMHGDASREKWGMYTGGVAEGQSSWTDVRPSIVPRQPRQPRGGDGMVVAAGGQPKAKRPKRSPKAKAPGSPKALNPGVQPPEVHEPDGPVLGPGGRPVPTLGNRKRGATRTI